MRFKEHSDVIIATAFLQVCTAYVIFLLKNLHTALKSNLFSVPYMDLITM